LVGLLHHRIKYPDKPVETAGAKRWEKPGDKPAEDRPRKCAEKLVCPLETDPPVEDEGEYSLPPQ
ncbi:MAG: hypothetical protein LIP28_03055, partial [Deltaproteobacteria bacterium]|nr:hypothetical protein [Deltaproteobacteria bacterium]